MTRTVPLSNLRGDVAVFKPSRTISAAVVDGALVVGPRRTRLSAPQVQALGGHGVLRIRLARAAVQAHRRHARIALVLRLSSQPKAGSTGPGAAGAIAVAPAVPTAPAGLDSSFDPLAGGRLYSSASPFNQPIPSDPPIAPSSAQMTEGLARAQAQKGFVLTVGEWTVPTYFAGPDTPMHSVSLGYALPRWGMAARSRAYPPGSNESLPWPLPTRLDGVPIPAGARPDPALDAHMTIIDRAGNCEYDLYGAHLETDGWHAVWANSTRLDGSGVYPGGMGTKASGFAGVAGLVWPQELRAGHIDHALFFAYPFTRSGGPVSPATASDGRTDSLEALPEGARVQLDPSLDLDSLGLKPYQRTIAEALQTYGMILGDTGGALGIYAVGRQGFAADPYEGILPADDFPDLGRIPTNRFRVLDLPPQQGDPPLRLAPSGCGSFS